MFYVVHGYDFDMVIFFLVLSSGFELTIAYADGTQLTLGAANDNIYGHYTELDPNNMISQVTFGRYRFERHSPWTYPPVMKLFNLKEVRLHDNPSLPWAQILSIWGQWRKMSHKKCIIVVYLYKVQMY